MSEIHKRLLSSIILLPIAIFCVIKGNLFFNFFLILIFLISIYEWTNMSLKKNYLFLGYIFMIFSFYTVFEIRNYETDNNLFIFMFLLLICIFTDIGGFIFGKILKGPRLTKISPNKTYSGAFGGYLFSIIMSFIIIKYLPDYIYYGNFEFSLNQVIFIIIISTVSQIGDILISFFKRLSNVKDTGKLIPGHGGVLDRIDGMIFVFPFYYIFYQMI